MFFTLMREILHTIKHADRGVFIPGRYIGENMIQILPIINKVEIKDKPGLLISIGFIKPLIL